MKRFSSFIATVALLEGVLSPSPAQFRWNPQPLPACRTFPITEIGFNYRVSSKPVFETFTFTDGSITDHYAYRSEQQLYFTSDLGFMKNLSPGYALGASNFVGFDKHGEVRGGLKLRVRKWLTNGTSVDISPGILLWDTTLRFPTPGFTGNVDFKFKEWLALSVLVEYRRAPGSENSYSYGNVRYRYVTKTVHDTGIYLGMKSGSSAGLIGHGVAGLATGIVYLIFLATFESS